MLTLQAQHDKFNALYFKHTTCTCLFIQTDWNSASVIDADFELPYESLPSGLMRMIYFLNECSYCRGISVLAISFPSRDKYGGEILVEAGKHCLHTIIDEMNSRGEAPNPNLLTMIRRGIRDVWPRYNQIRKR